MHWVFVTNVDLSVAADAQRTHVTELVRDLASKLGLWNGRG